LPGHRYLALLDLSFGNRLSKAPADVPAEIMIGNVDDITVIADAGECFAQSDFAHLKKGGGE